VTNSIGDGPYVCTFPCDQRSVQESREFTARLFNALGLSADTALLLVSEAVTNGVVHAGTKVRVAWSRVFCQQLCCEVTDFGAGFPRRIDADPDAEHGRGMFLIEELALATRVISTPSGGTTVKFMLEAKKQ
jgi:anti-sigma regulatory factor (Ser/Thr protein kinase)